MGDDDKHKPADGPGGNPHLRDPEDAKEYGDAEHPELDNPDSQKPSAEEKRKDDAEGGSGDQASINDPI